MSDDLTLTYEIPMGPIFAGEADVRLEYDRFGDWTVEVWNLETKRYQYPPRDWHDRIMTWAWEKHRDALEEHMADCRMSWRAADRVLAAE